MKTTSWMLTTFCGSVLLLALALPAVAHDRDDDEDGTRVVATGLLSPRGLDFDASGQLYVAESGITAAPGAGVPCFTGGMGPQCYSEQGALTRVDSSGHRDPVQVLKNLTSLGDVGPNDVSFRGQTAYVAIGLGADPAVRGDGSLTGAARANELGTVLRSVPSHSRHYSVAADVAAVEAACDSDGRGLDSNPFGVLALPGRLIVVDAGANVLLDMSRSACSRVIAKFPAELTPTTGPRDRVPSRVAQGPDGYLYVGEEAFGAGAGQARVYRVPPSGCVPIDACEKYLQGFSSVMDLEFDRRGNLYVLELGGAGPTTPPLAGALYKFDRSKSKTTIASGLPFVGGLALGHEAAFVSTGAVCTGLPAAPFCGADGKGQVIRISLDDDDDDNGHGGHH